MQPSQNFVLLHHNLTMDSPEPVELFQEVCAQDFLNFEFGGRSYQDQLYDAIAKTKVLAGISVQDRYLPIGDDPAKSIRVVLVTHDFGFLGRRVIF